MSNVSYEAWNSDNNIALAKQTVEGWAQAHPEAAAALKDSVLVLIRNGQVGDKVVIRELKRLEVSQ